MSPLHIEPSLEIVDSVNVAGRAGAKLPRRGADASMVAPAVMAMTANNLCNEVREPDVSGFR